MQAKRIAAVIVLFVIIGAAATFVTTGNKSDSSKNGLQVVAAENFWGNIASQLGGMHVHVTSIITSPSADPHLYESNAKNAAVLSSANIVIVNGEGYDDFMSKLLGGSKNNNQIVLTAQQILGAADGTNQHLWYDIPRVNEVAKKITDSYISKDPVHTAEYEHNLAFFDQSLQPLLQLINQIRRQYPGAPIAYTEPVPGYLVSATGLTVKTPKGFAKSIEDGTDPSPVDIEAMDTVISTKAARVLLYNAQATSPVTEHIKILAKQVGMPVIGVTETLPVNEKTYQSWQSDQLKQLEKALADTN